MVLLERYGNVNAQNNDWTIVFFTKFNKRVEISTVRNDDDLYTFKERGMR